MQKEAAKGAAYVPVLLVTGPAPEREIAAALAEIAALDGVVDRPAVAYRIEDFEWTPQTGETRRMALYVQKYGGSSVADAECMRRVAQRIDDTRKAGNQVVVWSAPWATRPTT